MISAISLYEDVAKDLVNQDQNGPFTFEKFNRISWRSQLRVIDWLTGNAKEGAVPPAPINNKNRDFLSQFIVKVTGQVTNGKFTKPSDYYTWQSGSRPGALPKTNCEEDCDEDEVPASDCGIPITLLGLDQFNDRCNTYIDELKPSFLKPIAKKVGNNFEFVPKDLGPVEIEYVRYPVRAEIKTKFDPLYNDVVPDENATINFEWDEWARELLIWFIGDTWSNWSREQALKQFNAASKPQP